MENLTSNESVNGSLVEELTPKEELLKELHDAFLLVVLVLTMLAMGADITWTQLWSHIKRPIGVALGMFCQFVLMPFLGFVIKEILLIRGFYAIGMLIVTCCPGGVVSNIFTYYCDGDVSLSIAMTSFSTILALGAMPLNLWIYGRTVGAVGLVIPYTKLATSMAYVTSPAFGGILIRWKLPRLAPFVTKVGSTIGLALFGAAMIMEVFTYPSMFSGIQWKLYLAVAIMPFSGITFGFCLSWIFRRPLPIRKTVAIESGVQNVVIALTIISLSFPVQQRHQLLLFPLLYGFSMISTCSLLSVMYQIYKRCFSAKDKVDESNKFEGAMNSADTIATIQYISRKSSLPSPSSEATTNGLHM